MGLEEARTRANEAIENLRTSTSHFLRQAASAYTEELLRFWEQGLHLVAGREDNLCPMCENLTLRTAERDELRARISGNQSYRSAFRTMESSIQGAVRAVGSLTRAVGTLVRPDLSEEHKATLGGLFQDDPNTITPVIQAVEECSRAKALASNGYRGLVESIP